MLKGRGENIAAHARLAALCEIAFGVGLIWDAGAQRTSAAPADQLRLRNLVGFLVPHRMAHYTDVASAMPNSLVLSAYMRHGADKQPGF